MPHRPPDATPRTGRHASPYLTRLEHLGLSLRARAFQPLADLLVIRTGANCFLVAAWLLLASVCLVSASDVHKVVVGSWLGVSVALDLAWSAVLCAVARGLVRFQRSTDRSHFRVVHPFFRGCTRPGSLLTLAYLGNALLGVGSALAGRMGWSAGAWHVVQCGELLPMALGVMMASCEWRRLPPARRRESADLPRGAATAST